MRYVPPERQQKALAVLSSLLQLGVGFRYEQGRLVALGAGVSPVLQSLVDQYTDIMAEYVPAEGLPPRDGVYEAAKQIDPADKMQLIRNGVQGAQRRQNAVQTSKAAAWRAWQQRPIRKIFVM